MSYFLCRLNPKVVGLASPVLLRMFLVSVFIYVDITVKNKGLFCNILCDQGPLSRGQVGKPCFTNTMSVNR